MMFVVMVRVVGVGDSRRRVDIDCELVSSKSPSIELG